MRTIKNLAKTFIKEHFHKFDLVKCDLEGYTEKHVIDRINKEYWFACWVIIELMCWALEEDYLKPYIVEHEGDFLVIKVDDKYFKINFESYCLDSVKLKTKTVKYFD